MVLMECIAYITPWKFNSSPLKMYLDPERKGSVSPPCFFRGYVKL